MNIPGICGALEVLYSNLDLCLAQSLSIAAGASLT